MSNKKSMFIIIIIIFTLWSWTNHTATHCNYTVNSPLKYSKNQYAKEKPEANILLENVVVWALIILQF